MGKDKRIIFTVTAGRSGTSYLAHVLQGLPGVRAEHEPLPGFHQQLPQARRGPALAKRFLAEEKLPAIEAFPEKIYIETGHYFCKGFIEPLWELGIVPDLILLKRNPRNVARSWFLMGAGMDALRNKNLASHMLDPDEPNFLPPHDWQRWNDYKYCYWYALEAFFRMEHYTALTAEQGGKMFSTYLQPLISGEGYEKLLTWIGMPPEITRERVSNAELRQQKVNPKAEQKKRVGLESVLADLKFDDLEMQVRRDCRLSDERLAHILK